MQTAAGYCTSLLRLTFKIKKEIPKGYNKP